MSSDVLQELATQKDTAALVDQIVADLDRPSPLIGADGPPDFAGPEEPYVLALDGAPEDVRQRFAEALRIILLREAADIASSRLVRRPLLLYNLFALLEAVPLPRIPEVLQTLREEEQPLRESLADRNDDLYAQLLIAHAVNQHGSRQDLAFWRRLLDHDHPDYVSAGIVGLRESGWENALTYLPAVKEALRRHPELGPLEDEVMLLIDTYPEQNWPDCARDFATDPEISQLINKHGRDRYVPGIDELSGPAAEIIRRAGKQEQVRRVRANWNLGSPALALAGRVNGR